MLPSSLGDLHSDENQLPFVAEPFVSMLTSAGELWCTPIAWRVCDLARTVTSLRPVSISSLLTNIVEISRPLVVRGMFGKDRFQH